MGRRAKLCAVEGCWEEVSRFSLVKRCATHDDEFEREKQLAFARSREGLRLAQLEECETVEDLKEFVKDHLLADE